MPVELHQRKSGGYMLTAIHVETGQLAELPFDVHKTPKGFELWAMLENDDEPTLHEEGLSEAEIVAEAEMMMPPYWR